LFYRAALVKTGGEICLHYEGKEYHLSEAGQRRRPASEPSGDLRAPMAGKIIQVLVQPGDTVTAGAPLLILEAMKMEQQITAPKDGVVDQILCKENEQVAAGAELVVLRDTAPDSRSP
jgi:biotin carboxyl carrier protein